MGSLLLNGAKKHTNKLCGWAVDHNDYVKAGGTAYLSPLRFYLKNGFREISNERLNTDKLTSVKVVWEKG